MANNSRFPSSQNQAQGPRRSAIQYFSLLGLKNLFFERTLTPTGQYATKPDPSRTPLLGNKQGENDTGDETSSTAGSVSDLESQTTIGEARQEKGSSRGWRIDARIISDATIGLSDGLTVPFALTAGLSALGNTNIVIWGGFAELIAGAISMGLGGYMAANGEA
jgi:hypothetical protein